MRTQFAGPMTSYEQALIDCEEIMERIDHIGRANDDLPYHTQDKEAIRNERDLQERAWNAVKALHQVLYEATGRDAE